MKQQATQVVQQIMNTCDLQCLDREVFMQLLKQLSLKEMYEVANAMKHGREVHR